MNITLSAEEKAIAKARAYAKKHQTSLNQLVRDYITGLANDLDVNASADEFADNALENAGKSADNYRFNRDSTYIR
jgi:hypothetical protein